ncbi:hypothetical protein CFP56_029960 [Quercus suber]|uniref:Uncharacterized protein n=1 Tax=Quercus suber TaxID=58331 RepID=A0AAW0JRK3_QUESU
MIRCLLEHCLATPVEIRTVLKSWDAVWKDSNEDTAYLTAWKRIQDKRAVLDKIHFSHLRRNLS